jgi:hypothetical protein
MEPQRPLNRFKAPFYLLIVCIGGLVVTVSLVSGSALVLALGLVVMLGGLGALWLIRTGRNPRWFQSPLDPKP